MGAVEGQPHVAEVAQAVERLRFPREEDDAGGLSQSPAHRRHLGVVARRQDDDPGEAPPQQRRGSAARCRGRRRTRRRCRPPARGRPWRGRGRAGRPRPAARAAESRGAGGCRRASRSSPDVAGESQERGGGGVDRPEPRDRGPRLAREDLGAVSPDGRHRGNGGGCSHRRSAAIIAGSFRPTLYNRSPLSVTAPVPRILPRSEHPISRELIDKNALKVLVPPAPGRLPGLPGGRQRARPDAGPQAQGLRRRHRAPGRTRSAGCSATPASSAGASGWCTSSSPTARSSRSRPSGAPRRPASPARSGAGAPGRPADHQRQRLRHAAPRTPSAATSRSTRSSTTSPTSR